MVSYRNIFTFSIQQTFAAVWALKLTSEVGSKRAVHCAKANESKHLLFFKKKAFKVKNARVGALVEWLWEETYNPKVVGSNPNTIYWMVIFSHLLVVKIVIFV